jgi:hypothetical protein
LQNYFNYFTEIEEHFQRRRGSLLMLSPVDWALIAVWQEAGFPLEAVLRGIDVTFDKYDARKGKARTRRINGLAYCAQAVLHAVEEMHEAATGARTPASTQTRETGFESARIAQHLRTTAAALCSEKIIQPVQPAARETAQRLTALAEEISLQPPEKFDSRAVEALEQNLLVLEDRLYAAATTAAPEEMLVSLRVQAARELAPIRSRLHGEQIRQIEQQFFRRQLFASLHLPRLSLFYLEVS